MRQIALLLALGLCGSAAYPQTTAVVSEVFNPDTRPPPIGVSGETMGNKFQGDMDIGSQSEPSNRNALTDLKTRWPGGRVCYYYSQPGDKYYSQPITQAIKDNVNMAISDFKAKSCITFVESRTETNCIEIINGDGCYSKIGMTGGIQRLSLQDPGCTDAKGVAIHELMHALGFSHEQSREDRDEYITVNWQNIKDGEADQFTKADFGYSAYGLPYDLNSVMQYGMNYFSINPSTLNTMTPKDPNVKQLGTRAGFTLMDLQKLNKVYCDLAGGNVSFVKFEDITAYKQTVVDTMNTVRRRTKSSSMMKLTWDATLQAVAEKAAQTCMDTPYEAVNGQGIVRYSHSSIYTDLPKAFAPIFADVQSTIEGFITQSSGFGPGWCCNAASSCSKPCGNEYMAILNGPASKVGCAVGRCNGLNKSGKAPNAQYVQGVCVFDKDIPDPFKMGQSPPYLTGTACADIKNKVSCDDGLGVGGSVCWDAYTQNCVNNVKANPKNVPGICAALANKYGTNGCDKSCAKC